MKKRIFSLLLGVVMLLTMLLVQALAAQTPEKHGLLHWLKTAVKPQ